MFKILSRKWMLLLAVIPGLVWAANPKVEIRTNRGTMIAELYPDQAPITVKNFLEYVNAGFYNNTVFHRVIKDFVVQGGGVGLDLLPKTANAPIKSESRNGLSNKTGTLAMARGSDPDSATSQFYINLIDNRHLDFFKPEPEYMGYTVFGKLIDGLMVAKDIGNSPTKAMSDFADVPEKPVIVESITLIKADPVPEPVVKGKKKKSKKTSKKR